MSPLPPAPTQADYLRWQNAQARRYYEVRLLRNLFGELELLRVWGGLDSRRAGQCIERLSDETASAAAIANAMRRRQRRGYALVMTRPAQPAEAVPVHTIALTQ